MLTESEKDRIRQEEVYRQEVKNDLENQNNKKFSFWVFLNSGFTLFLLSTVFIGGLSFLYKEWKNNQAENERKEIKEVNDNRIKTKLTEEVLVRLSVIEKLRDTIPEYKSKNVLIAYWGNSIREDKSLDLKYYHLRPLFVEYEQWTLLELLTELKRYSDKQVSKSISQTRDLLIEKSEELNGGVHILSKTKKGSPIPPGRLIRPNKSTPNIWKYITTKNELIELTNDKIPLTRYYSVAHDQAGLIKQIQKLKLILIDNKGF